MTRLLFRATCTRILPILGLIASLGGCATRAEVQLLGAANSGDVETVRSALDSGASADAFDEYGLSALDHAILANRVDVVRLLVDRGATVRPAHLLLAARAGHPDTVRTVLDLGADINAIGGDGGTALHAASGSTSAEVIRLLIEAGVPVDAQRGDGGTVLLLASENGYASAVAALLAAGADPNVANNAGQTPLDWAVARGHADVATLLRNGDARSGSRGIAGDPEAMKRSAEAASGRPLLTQTTGVVTDGRTAKIRASVTNTYDEAVAGVRYMVGLATTTGQILEWVQRESDVRIAPGRRIIARLDISSVYIGAEAGSFVVLAFPAKLGNDAVDPPAEWK